MQNHQASGNGNSNGDHPSQQQSHQQPQQLSFDGIDMQRFQQQLQAAQHQYRQQQQQQQHYGVGGGTGTSTPSPVGMSMMPPPPQQQSLLMNNNNPNAIGQPHTNNNNNSNKMPPTLHGMYANNNMTTGSAMIGGNMGQFSGGNSDSNSNNNNNSMNSAFDGSNWGNPASAQQQSYHINNITATDVGAYQHFDANGRGGHHRMMSGSGGGGAAVKSNNNNSNHMNAYRTAGGISGMMGHINNDPTNVVNSVLANTENSSTALQNMQLLLLKQQQQVNRTAAMHPEQQHNRAMLSGLPSTFNASHQFSKSPVNAPMGTPGGNVGGGTGGNITQQQQQQMLLFQQQLSALQKQQQQMTGGGGVSAKTGMVAMQQSKLQQLAGDGNHNSLYGAPQQLPNSATALSSSLHASGALQQQQNLHLQARQQQIVQQMQQQQLLNHSATDSATMDGSANSSFNLQANQQAGSILRNISSTSTGMFHMMNQPPMHQQGLALEQQMQLQNSGNRMPMMNFQQTGMMGGQNNSNNIPSSLKDNNNNEPSSSMDGSSANSTMTTDQTPFLDGRFAGGWQSNADLPERREIIFSILEVIKQMRPDTSKLSNKLPHMAKSLEEHLYRSAKSKEEYMDVSTLKTRLQAIAHGLEVHRSTDSTPVNAMNTLDSSSGAVNAVGDQNWSVATALRSNNGEMAGLSSLLGNTNPGPLSSSPHLNNVPMQGMYQNTSGSYQGVSVQQQGGSLSYHQGVTSGNSLSTESVGLDSEQGLAYQMQGQSSQGMNTPSDFLSELDSQQDLDQFSMQSTAGARDSTSNQQLQSTQPWTHSNDSTNAQSTNMDFSMASKFKDPTEAQKMRVIIQQQQRLLLLRHASKCTAGAHCTTKFCEQMVTLWKHMKTCRDKNCKTSHCLSSRCVLNHYRVCKANGRTLMCEVCGPVMIKIKQQERDDGTNDDPLTRDQEMVSAELQRLVSAASVPSCAQHLSNQSQLHMVQAVQTKLKAQLDILKLLQKHQEQLLEQQKRLEAQAQNITDPNSPEFVQLQEQQVLLQQLQKRCQQQQLLIQHEIQMPASGSSAKTSEEYSSNVNDEPTLTSSSDVKNSADSKTSAKKQSDAVVKRTGKSLVLPPSRKSKSKNSDSPSIASSISDRSTKKAKVTQKLRAIISTAQIKPESEVTQKRLEEDHASQLSCMTSEEIRKHLDSLNKRIVLSSRTVTHKCRPILQELMDDQFGWVFHDAVDPVALGLPDYFDVIKNPMHMDLIRKKLENAIYPDMDSFAHDMRLVFQNSIVYNGESSEVGELAQSMMSRFEKLFDAVQADIEHSHINLESQGELCSLCGLQKRRYEPTVLYCQGKCGMQRIKRNEPYFTDRTKQNHWCEPCFNLLDPDKHVLLDDGSEIAKQELQEFKNDALPEEGWVNCDSCHSWVHQVCALFNGRTNKSNARFTCPNCCIVTPSTKESRDMARKVVKSAKDLPRCKMSDALEKGLHDSLHAAYTARSAELGVALENIEKANELCVRVLSNVEKKNLVGEKMLQRYKFKDYPSEFPLRSKCIALFQTIHGVDTLLFAMYVYEYGDDCPAPNRRHVYISYLDSVRYFEPKVYRTTAYHSVMVEYLRYVKKRGFHTASIWSCPPVNGDDYIFYCHPKHQLVPREDMLRAWYHKMLDQAKSQGIVLSTSSLYDEYFPSDNDINASSRQLLTPTCLPYFEGDYIPGELEIIIQQCETNGDTVSDLSSHDTVMTRLGHNLLKMKDNFIVVHLRNRRFADAVQRGEDVSHWKEDSDDEMVRSKRAKISAKLSPESDLGKIQIAANVTEVRDFSSGSECVTVEMKIETSTNLYNNSFPEKSTNSLVSINEQSISGAGDCKTTVELNEQPTIVKVGDESSTVPQELESANAHDATSDRLEHEPARKNADETAERPTDEAAEIDEPLDDMSQQSHGNSKSSFQKTLSVSVDKDAIGKIAEEEVAYSADVAEIKSDEPLDIAQQLHDVSKSSDEETLFVPTDNTATSSKAAKQVDLGTVVEAGKPVDESASSNCEAIVDPADSSAELIEVRVTNSSSTDGKVPADAVVEPLNVDEINRHIPVLEKNSENTSQMTTSQNASCMDNYLAVGEKNDKGHPEDFTEDLQSKNKRAFDEVIPAIVSHFKGVTNLGEIVSDTSDDDPPMESEMFDSRQQFLNYCQSAHCQFDELRRAKHSTVMVLFQLHNPSAPKFLQQCGACYRDITHGIRHHCNDCSNFDLCEDCYEPIVAGTWAKRDPRFAHDEHHTFTAIDMESSDDTAKSQADRQNSLKAHVKLLEHAAFCGGAPTCTLHNCDRFKKIFLHCADCDIKPKRDCKICTRLLVLCTMHSRLCNARDPCPVPFCDRIRERNKRLYRQQQLMDDRRRQAQNELYHAGGES